MLHKACFTPQWIQEQAKAQGSPNPIMLEKAIVALQLLGHLVETDLPLQFKGGTSLLLRLNPIRRLSIDVDIVTQATPGELMPILERVAKMPPFTGYEHSEQRDKDLPPKKHFKFHYPTAVNPRPEHILLDVLFESSVTPHSESILIKTPFIQPEREVRVSVPTVNSLLGDKLTAFAPKTIGILHHEERRLDIVKQLFDVGALFDAASDLNVAAEVYREMHARQLKYRNATFSLADTLNDTIEAGRHLAQLNLKGAEETEDGLFLLEGVKALQNHLLRSPFNLDEARIAAGKAACAAAWIMMRPSITLDELRYRSERVEELRQLQLQSPWNPLTRIKGANPEAFHYWHTAQRILAEK